MGIEWVMEFVYEHPWGTLGLAAVLLFGWDFVAGYVSSGGNIVTAILGAFSGTAKTTVTATTTITTDVFKAIQTLELWCVQNGKPELLTKITSMWADLKELASNNQTSPAVTVVPTIIPAAVTPPVPGPVLTPPAATGN